MSEVINKVGLFELNDSNSKEGVSLYGKIIEKYYSEEEYDKYIIQPISGNVTGKHTIKVTDRSPNLVHIECRKLRSIFIEN